MSKSSNTHYGRIARWFHWAIAWTMILALTTGFLADSAGPTAHWFLRVHLMTGLTVAPLAIARIGWWMFFDRRPKPMPAPMAQRWLAATAHGILTAIPLVMLASGIGMIMVSGAGTIVMDTANQQPLPVFELILPRRPHGFGAKLLLGAIVLHVIGVAYHQIVLNDGLLQRMRRPVEDTHAR